MSSIEEQDNTLGSAALTSTTSSDTAAAAARPLLFGAGAASTATSSSASATAGSSSSSTGAAFFVLEEPFFTGTASFAAAFTRVVLFAGAGASVGTSASKRPPLVRVEGAIVGEAIGKSKHARNKIVEMGIGIY